MEQPICILLVYKTVGSKEVKAINEKMQARDNALRASDLSATPPSSSSQRNSDKKVLQGLQSCKNIGWYMYAILLYVHIVRRTIRCGSIGSTDVGPTGERLHYCTVFNSETPEIKI
eukprot:scaffold169333_cov52-Attheya_sp.AAC.4